MFAAMTVRHVVRSPIVKSDIKASPLLSPLHQRELYLTYSVVILCSRSLYLLSFNLCRRMRNIILYPTYDNYVGFQHKYFTKQLETGHPSILKPLCWGLFIDSHVIIFEVNCSSYTGCELLCICEPRIVIPNSGSYENLGPTDLQLVNLIWMAEKL